MLPCADRIESLTYTIPPTAKGYIHKHPNGFPMKKFCVIHHGVTETETRTKRSRIWYHVCL